MVVWVCRTCKAVYTFIRMTGGDKMATCSGCEKHCPAYCKLGKTTCKDKKCCDCMFCIGVKWRNV